MYYNAIMNHTDTYVNRYQSEALSVTTFFNQVYAWMCVGLGITGLVAAYVADHASRSFYSTSNVTILVIVELVLVFFLAAISTSLPTIVSGLVFLFYAALNGVSLSVVFKIYTHSAIASAFFISAGIFATAALYGFFTKRSLESVGSFFGMLLWGLILAMIVSIFYSNTWIEYAINLGGVVIFVGLTAYDNQRLKELAQEGERSAILGSLILYLDFINIFLFVLQLLNNSSDE